MLTVAPSFKVKAPLALREAIPRKLVVLPLPSIPLVLIVNLAFLPTAILPAGSLLSLVSGLSLITLCSSS